MLFRSNLKVLAATSLTWLLAQIPGFGQHTFLLEDASVLHRLDKHVQVFIDSTNSLTIDHVVRPDFQNRFQASTGNLTFGYLKPAIWLKVKSRIASANEKWYLEIPAPFLEYVDFYQSRDDSTWHKTSSGYFRKQSEKEFPHTSHMLPLHFGQDSLSTVYVRIGGISPKTFPVYAIESERFTAKTRLEDLGYGVFFGILAVMFFYNMFIYSTLRQKNYLLYACIIACTFLLFSAISGYGGKFLWPEKPAFNYINGKLVLEMIVIFLTIYTISFLEVKKYSTALYYALWSLVPLAIIALFLSTTQILPSAGNHLITLSIVVFITAGIVVRAKGNKTGSYFIAAWTSYFVGGLLVTLRNSAVFDFSFWTTHFVEAGAILGTTIMGFGLAAQYRKLENEKEEAQYLALKIQQEATAKLEMKVNKRTEQLYQANKDLQRTLETNRKQTQIIESKNTELDTFFYRISHDLKGPISSSLGLMVLAKIDVKDPLALEYIGRQHAQLERLSHIVSGLISLTNLNNGDLVKVKIDFGRMIDDCIMSFNTFKNFPRLTFEKNIQQNIEFHSEWTLLNAILQNLIENSIKYCGEEAPYVKISVRDEAGWIVIQVEDNGLGIPEEHHQKIFDMFYRATNESEGSGLGLYILKRSVDRLQGSVALTSQVGVGSTFVVRLPHRQVNDEVSVGG